MSNNETYTVLWETDTPFKNQYTISLNDSIDNYDEIICYGSANRGGNDRVNVKTTYPVVSGCINLGGPYTLNTWQSTNHYMLNNGTQVYLSGNSGFIDVSYYWGMQNGGTGFEANRYTTARNADVHPYKIVGVKTKLNDKIWETTGNTYETNIQLNEPITHFNKLLIYGSGTDNSAYGVHLAKNVYTVQPLTVNGCDVWGYSPWSLNFRCNYLLGCSLKLSGNSGHIGSAYYWGIGLNNATWAAGKWTGDLAPKMLQPYKIFGLDRKPTYNVNLLQTEGGTIAVTPNKGYEFDIATLTNTTANEDYKFSSYNITGATLTGDQFQFETNDVKVQGNFEHNKTLTLINGEHGILSADKDKGFIGDVVTVTGTMDEGWYLTGFNTTGATMTGNKFAFAGEDVTVEALFSSAVTTSALYYTTDSVWAGRTETITINQPCTAFQYVAIQFNQSGYGGGGAEAQVYKINDFGWNMRWHYTIGNYKPLRNGGSYTGIATNTGTRTTDTTALRYYKGVSENADAKFKLVVDRNSNIASAFWNNIVVCKGSVNASTAITTIYKHSEQNYTPRNVGRIRCGGFKNLSDAAAWNP